MSFAGQAQVFGAKRYAAGDKLVYCEIDSLLPERPEFEFLRPSSFKPAQTDAVGGSVLPAGFRIKTVKLRGQVSQGICFPLTILPDGAPTEEGADVSELLGVLKWEPSRGGDLFPHLYGTLSLDAVLWVKPLPLGADGRHLFPELEP